MAKLKEAIIESLKVHHNESEESVTDAIKTSNTLDEFLTKIKVKKKDVENFTAILNIDFLDAKSKL